MRLAALTLATSLALGLAACSTGAGGGKGQHTASGTGQAKKHFSREGLYEPDQLVSKTDPGTHPVKQVKWGLRTGEPATLDPAKTGNDSDYIVAGNLCESLYTVDEMFGLQPNLATEATWTNPTTLDLFLRDDVTFWDGSALSADDVVASLKRTAAPQSGSIYAGSFVLVKDIKAMGDLHVRVTFKDHDADFIDAIAAPSGRIVQAKSIAKLGKNLGTPKGGLMCTGPYSLNKWTPGQDITLDSNPKYWGGEPQVKQMKFVPTQDDASITSALLSGDLDGAFDIPESATKKLADSKRGSVYIGPSNSTLSFGPTTDHGPAADPRVRQALSLAIDREALIRSVLRGYGEPATTFTVPFQFKGLEQAETFERAYQDLQSPDRDLKKAKALVKKAGTDGEKLTVLVPSGNQMLLNIATMVKAAAKEIGLDIDIQQRQPAEYAKFFYAPEAREGVDFIVAVGYQDTPGVNTYASLNLLPGDEGLFNWSKYENPQVTKLLRSARSATDSKRAAKDFVSAQKIFSKDYVQVTLGVQYTRAFMRKGLSGTTTSISYISTPWAKDLGGTTE